MNSQILGLIKDGIYETFYMVILSTAFAYLIGVPVGVVLNITSPNGIKPNRVINLAVGFITNVIRSVPFLILLVAILPFTRLVVGTTIGSTATVVPLVVAAAPFVARLVESSLKEVDSGVIEAAKAMGSSTWQIIWKVLLAEAKPSLLVGSVIAFATILGYSAMAGFVGGGGLGAIAVNYGYYRYKTDVMLITVAILIVIVQVIQELGIHFINKLDKRIN
ncbi:MAG TPA: methionine ABC transporter permease [Lachnospiraceae bacterium]|jgi:D-methionine transport system permease protein|nr:methionine ABC transporter permease [Lachnospiraceae bacterium]